MATKLQELLEELKGLSKWDILEGNEDMDFDIIERPAGEFIKSGEILQLITKYTETTPTYKPGDSVRVIKCLSGHGFRIGEVVTLCNVNKNFFWKCANEDDVWYMKEEEFEPIN